MQRIFFILLVCLPQLAFANVQHIGKWLLNDENSQIIAMTSSPNGGILNISCLPNNDLLLELYSFFQPANEKGTFVVAIDGVYSVWSYQGNGIVATPEGSTILEKNLTNKNINVELFYEQKSIVKYNFDIDGVDELSTKLKLMCNSVFSS